MTKDELEELPLPVVVEIKPINQFADMLFGMVTAPAKEQRWNKHEKDKKWDHVEYEKVNTK
jgi:hypothetical protein